MNFGNKSIFFVDWSLLTFEYFYLASQVAVGTIAKAMVTVLELIMAACKIVDSEEVNKFLKNVQIAGQSLGSHIAGRVGRIIFKKFNFRIGVIFGLDPAGPQFDMQILPKDQFRLNPNNARFVQILHTGMALLGNPDTLGHADYYGNGGACQPDCDCSSLPGMQCNHMRAVYLFRASMYLMAIGYQCVFNNECATMPFDEVFHRIDYYGIHTRGRHGVFYVPTSAKPPFFNYDMSGVIVPSFTAEFSGEKEVLGIGTGINARLEKIRIKWENVPVVVPVDDHEHTQAAVVV